MTLVAVVGVTGLVSMVFAGTLIGLVSSLIAITTATCMAVLVAIAMVKSDGE